MKIQLLLLFLFTSFISYAQQTEDCQWLVRDGKYEIGTSALTNAYSSQVVTSPYLIEGLTRPGLPHNGKTPEKRLFTIFTDGTYSVSSVLNGNFTTLFRSNRSIAYQYLTNIYDDTEPPSEIVIDTSPPITPSPSSPLNQLPLNLSNSSFLQHGYSNQELMNNDDVIFVLPNTTTKLCFDSNLLQNVKFYSSGFKEFSSTGNLIYLNGTTNRLSEATVQFVGNCITIPTLQNQSGSNIYLNFNFKNDLEDLDRVEFELSLTGQSRKKEFFLEVSSKVHDPNYIELVCVWEDANGDKYARYHVECYNDGPSNVRDVALQMTLPDAAIISTVKITNWKVGKDKGCGEHQLDMTLSASVPNALMFNFNSLLDDLEGLTIGEKPTYRHTAWVEFCVQLDSDTNIFTDGLQPLNPFTTFTGRQGMPYEYDIIHFIDHTTCIPLESFPSSCQEIWQNGDCFTVRSNTTKCSDCKCENVLKEPKKY